MIRFNVNLAFSKNRKCQGRHYTQRIISVNMASPQMASLDILDMHDTPRHVEVGANGQLVVLATLRDLLPGELQGSRYFPLIYKSHRDQVTFGFKLSFDADVSPRYLTFYRQ